MNTDIDDLRMSEIIELVRGQLAASRRTLDEAMRKHACVDSLDHISGLCTCGIAALYHAKGKFVELEIARDDQARGQHLAFNPRGIGLDVCPGCFVCGTYSREQGVTGCLHNIAAFIDSKECGEELVTWFGGRARLDFRPNEPSWIQLKVGACSQHLPNLRHLEKVTARYGVIRRLDIYEAERLGEPTAVEAPPAFEAG